MKILFLSLSSAASSLKNRGIYPDLLRTFALKGHDIYIVSPAERRTHTKTNLTGNENVHLLKVWTPNITKANFLEKGIGTLIIGYLYRRAIRKHLKNITFDLILYSTPPITLTDTIRKVKKQSKTTTYLLLKDIFPQNAVDLKILSKQNPLYHYFRYKEKQLYAISDYIGCMSPKNKSYLIQHNPTLNPEKIEICPNAIEPMPIPTDWDKNTIRATHNIPTNALVVISGGNLGKPQGINFLLKILQHYLNRLDVFFIVCGNGTEAIKVKQFFEKHSPINALFFDFLPREKYDRLVFASDIGLILLNPDFTIPNFPSRLLNYLELKKPVLLATDRATDMGEIASANHFGLWSVSGDLDGFCQNLDELNRNREKIAWMGENGYRFLLENYTTEHIYKIITSHFNI
ncbi:MAG TPA: glycosyltransferase family 4 protein [Salinivirgaceae bacterium]|nr:glycosyltransferase family 4 protein [Salinivirgaceae bacterium]